MRDETGSVECRTESETATQSLGRRIGGLLRAGDVIGLTGPLGAGKTQLVKGIAAGLGIDPAGVSSPTFVLVNEYDGRIHVYHIDAYRLSGASQLAALGFEDMCGSGGAVMVEWADRVADVIPERAAWIALEPTGETTRRVIIGGPEAILARFRDACRS